MDNLKGLYLPQEWDCDRRMRVLMGPMPHIDDNPTAYNSRLIFWTTNLHQWMRCKEGLSFSIQEARLAFRRETLVPQCLEQVIDHLLRQGEILTYQDFQSKIINSESWPSWGKRVFLTTPSRWAWRYVKDFIRGSQSSDSIFIHWIIVQEMADKILSHYWSRIPATGCDSSMDILTVQEFFRISKSAVSNLIRDDIDIILQYLSLNKKVSIRVSQDQTFIKLIKPCFLSDSSIKDSEIAEYELKNTEVKLENRIASLQHEISPLRDQAKQLVLNGSKKQALSKLKRKKQLEISLDRTSISYENVSTCLRQLQDSKLNKDILKSFQLGVNALKTSLDQIGSAEEVTDTMETLQDILDDCNDVTEVLSTGVQSPADIDDSVLEKELDDLLRVSLENESVDLPPVPTGNPFAPSGIVLESSDLEEKRLQQRLLALDDTL